eukprot:2377251-Rhodomonas_salina.1
MGTGKSVVAASQLEGVASPKVRQSARAHDAYCKQHDFDTPLQTPIPESFEPNICARNAVARQHSTCLHHQGVVGGESGGAVRTIGRLYHRSFAHASTVYDTEDFLVAAHPTLWAGRISSLGLDYVPGRQRMLRMPADIIYPAHIILSVAGGGSVLKVQSYQMQSSGGGLHTSEPRKIGP